MIFVGDIAVANDNFKLYGIPASLFEHSWIGNLEGSIVDSSNNGEHVVYNEINSFQRLVEELPLKAVTLANNHIFDMGVENFRATTSFLERNDIKHLGAGLSEEEASGEIVVEQNGIKAVILNFGWSVIQCQPAKGQSPGTNKLTRKWVIQSLKDSFAKYPDAHHLVLMHWSYELEAEPQPYERALAHELIDLGASAIIGSHPHRLGGVEVYNGRPIVYSLGNWLFTQDFFFNKKLSHPSFCDMTMSFEWHPDLDKLRFHFFKHQRDSNTLVYLHSEKIGGTTLRKLTPFENLSEFEYKDWYRKNHYHKRKGLPIYYYDDSNIMILFKDLINRFRDLLIKVIRN